MIAVVADAIRQVRRNPGFTAVATLVIALGVGATSAVLSVVNGVLVAPLPYPDADRLVILSGRMTRDSSETPWPLSPLDLEDARGLGSAFDAVASVSNVRSFNFVADGEIEHISGELVTADFFRVFGVRATIGRVFLEEEARAPGAAQVAVISDALWRRRYGADPAVIGRSVMLNDASYQLIGVLPPRFHGSSDGADVWLPLGLAAQLYHQPAYLEMREFRWIHGIARIRDGLTVEAAQALADGHSRAMREQYPKDNRGLRIHLMPLVEAARGQLEGPLLALLAAAGFVLLIVCTNVANLLLARGASRARELAVRRALGAETGRIVRQLLSESAVLGLLGGGLGLLVAGGIVKLLLGSGSLSLASYHEVGLDWRVVVATLVLVVAATFGFGLAPAVMAARTSAGDVVKGSSRGATAGSGQGRFQSLLIAVEVGIALVLLVGAGLTTKGFRHFMDRDLGFRPDGLLSMRLDFSMPRYLENEPYSLALGQLVERIRTVPGVEAVALEGPGFPTSAFYAISLTPADGSLESMQVPQARRHNVTPGYFKTLGIPLIAGRDIDERDQEGTTRVTVLSRRLAEKLWPGQDPLGRQLLPNGNREMAITVIGVARDVRHQGPGLDDDAFSDAYFAAAQFPPRNPALAALLVRGGRDVARLVGPITRVVDEIAPGVAPYQVNTIRGHLGEQSAEGRFLMLLMTAFALMALGLAAIGIYGVVAATVEQQTREIGVRMALGAGRGSVRRLILRRTLVPAVVGGLVGVFAAAGLSQVARSLLYGISPFDPATFALVLGVLGAVAVAATLVPARRATAIDPLIALRAE